MGVDIIRSTLLGWRGFPPSTEVRETEAKSSLAYQGNAQLFKNMYCCHRTSDVESFRAMEMVPWVYQHSERARRSHSRSIDFTIPMQLFFIGLLVYHNKNQRGIRLR